MGSFRIMELRWSLIICCLIIICCSFSYVACDKFGNFSDPSQSTLVNMPANDSSYDFEMRSMQKWKNAEKLIHKMAIRALRNIFVQVTGGEITNVSQKCVNDLGYFMRGIATMKYWAYKMLDSSGRIPVGILSGTLADLGDYKGCLSIDVKNRFQGKYCNARISPFAISTNIKTPELDISKFYALINQKHDETFLNQFLTAIHPLYGYYTFRVSLCIPSSCDNEDVEQFLNKVSQFVGLDWEASVLNCNTRKEKEVPYNGFQLFALTMIFASLLVAAIGTSIDIVLHYYKDCRWKSALLVRIFLCFSFVTNTKRLLKKDNNPDSIKIFHGMKAFTILWVILNHTYNCVQADFMSGAINIKNVISTLSFQIVLNGYPTVDTFFFITGVILVYSRMRNKIKSFSIPMYIFRRAWRLGPAVFFLTFGFFLIPTIGDGPFWKEKISITENACSNYWWANLIYINNFLATENQCMLWLWYVAADMQLYILALIVIVPIKMRPKLGLWLLGGCSLACVAAIIFNQIYNQMPPTVVLSALLQPGNVSKATELGYYPFYTHAIVTCIGMATGYVIYKFPTIKIPPLLNLLGWATAFVFGLATVYGVHKWNYLRDATALESVVYAAGGKIAWSLGLAWVTVVCVTGNGGVVAKFLSWNAFTPISRMTYSTYVIHMVIEVYFFYNTQQPIEAQHRVLALMYVGFVVLSFIVGFVYTQLFESPYMNLEKIFLPSMASMIAQQEKTKPEDTLEENKVNENRECNGNGNYTNDISKMKIEYKSEKINSSSL